MPKDDLLENYEELVDFLKEKLSFNKTIVLECFSESYMKSCDEIDFETGFNKIHENMQNRFVKLTKIVEEDNYGLQKFKSLGLDLWRSLTNILDLQSNSYLLMIMEDNLPCRSDMDQFSHQLRGLDINLANFIDKLDIDRIRNSVKRIRDLTKTLYV